MSTILLAVDRDEDRAVAQAESIVELELESASTRVRVVHIFTNNPEGASVTQLGAVRRAKAVLEGAGFDVEVEGRSGDPVDEILDAADEHDADVITIAGRKRSPAGKALFGSVAQGVFLNTNRSVLLCSERDA
ncbi:universal stress protein [Natronosalvus caseinilyticus]|uniref:universal stress protein n=1 Tax=Natronosalvus caseinilyticus TaxID=2953747 RepID=UPI0028A73E0A|nr:universal stress protein [Natronosalvus caseinilyticus]